MNKIIKQSTDALRKIIADLRSIDLGIYGNEAVREECNDMLKQISAIEKENE